jgi:hypothetical protein
MNGRFSGQLAQQQSHSVQAQQSQSLQSQMSQSINANLQSQMNGIAQAQAQSQLSQAGDRAWDQSLLQQNASDAYEARIVNMIERPKICSIHNEKDVFVKDCSHIDCQAWWIHNQ